MINYNIMFEPNGGDLGRAGIKYVTPLEFQIIIPHVAYILESLYLSRISRLPFKYAFEFPVIEMNKLLLVMDSVKLPSHVKFYETDGKRLFEMRGVSGGIATNYICYLITGD